jgi:hypothetical protein
VSAAIKPLDPASPAGKAAAAHLTDVLAEIQVAIWRRERATANASATTDLAPAPSVWPGSGRGGDDFRQQAGRGAGAALVLARPS